MPRKRKQNLPNGGRDRRASNGHFFVATTRQSNGGSDDQTVHVGYDRMRYVVLPPPDMPVFVAEIRSWHRQRCFAMEQRKRLDLALGAFLRMMLGWSRDLPESERKKIAARVAKLIKDSRGSEWESVISAASAGRKPFAEIEKRAVKELADLAERLPAP